MPGRYNKGQRKKKVTKEQKMLVESVRCEIFAASDLLFLFPLPTTPETKNIGELAMDTLVGLNVQVIAARTSPHKGKQGRIDSITQSKKSCRLIVYERTTTMVRANSVDVIAARPDPPPTQQGQLPPRSTPARVKADQQ